MKNINKLFVVASISFLMFFNFLIPANAQVTNDSGCTSRGGSCQTNSGPSSCSNGSFVSGLCTGPTNRQCCISGGGGGSASGSTGGKTSGFQIISLPNPLGAVKTIPQLIGRIVDWLILIASIAVLPFMIIWGAYQLLTAGGNPEAVTKARHTITWAVVGYGLLLISKGIEFIIRDILTRNA